jgi:hypothetical protein
MRPYSLSAFSSLHQQPGIEALLLLDLLLYPISSTYQSYLNTTYLGQDHSEITWHTPWSNFHTHPTTIQPCSQNPLLYTFTVDPFKLSHTTKQTGQFY